MALLLFATAAGCSGKASTRSTAPPSTASPSTVTNRPAPVRQPTQPATPPVVWSPCSAGSTLQCGTVSVPVDYRNPNGPSILLALKRAPSLNPADPDGTLVFNPGGPGESGDQILPVALLGFPAAVRQDFDIVTFDPRGTGASDPLRCGTSPSVLSSVLPVPAEPGTPLPGTPAFSAMAQSCETTQADLAPYVDTTNTARDLDRIRQSLGLKTISYYGWSYGTVLGAVYAQLFPHRVTTMVLDGAVDINASLTQQANQEAPAAERSLNHLLSTCAASPACPLGNRPAAYFRTLSASLLLHPLPAPGNGDNQPVTVGDLDTATLLVLSALAFTPQYEAALVAAHNGNGAPLRTLALELVTDIDGAPLVDPLWAITCNDAAVHPSPVEAGNQARDLAARYPLIGAYAVTYTMGGCVAWPPGRQPVTDVHPVGAPPIMVIGNTGDPNTPLVNARHLTAALPSAHLVIWNGWGHTWLLSGSADACMQKLVTTYLTGGGLAPSGIECN